jgi:hypothetical protein
MGTSQRPIVLMNTVEGWVPGLYSSPIISHIGALPHLYVVVHTKRGGGRGQSRVTFRVEYVKGSKCTRRDFLFSSTGGCFVFSPLRPLTHLFRFTLLPAHPLVAM